MHTEETIMTLSRRDFLVHSAAGLGLAFTFKHQAIAAAAGKTGLAELYKKDFLVGTAISTATLDGNDQTMLNLIKKEFNAITAENVMKWGVLNPEPGIWNWNAPDRMVNFGVENDMFIQGHTLVWHSQAPQWLFQDKGQPVSREKLLKRMESHIDTVVGRYKGKIGGWDVVNEAIDEEKGWRKSPWFNIIGPEYMELAFRLAHEADPKAHLIYNDYNMHLPGKREFLFEVIRGYQKRNVPIHGVGLQGHVGLKYPDLTELENSIKACRDHGLAAHITELDVDVLPVAWDHTGANVSDVKKYSDELNPYTAGLPGKVQQQLTDRYVQLFEMFLEHRDTIARVTTWGTSDHESWKNGFPVRGRTNYPLLFDRSNQPKPAYYALRHLKS
jgi:endo-1,4-beta-xylanase